MLIKKVNKKLTVTKKEAEKAVRILIQWIGENPDREGLVETPKRLIKSFEEQFNGYNHNPITLLEKTFTEIDQYNGMVLLKDIKLESHCEHHIAPILGKVHIAYIPDKRVVGISKLARVVEAYAKRLQIQERLTSQIGHAIEDGLKPKGVAVVIEATHYCLSKRGIRNDSANMSTQIMLGVFKSNSDLRREFFQMIK